jgi:hypothetical protein
VQQAKSPNLWSGRVSKDLRAILQKDGETWIAVYVGRHDDAYDWASKYIVGKHPLTGIWQVVPMPVVTDSDPADTRSSPALFASRPDNYLLSLGVPEIWLPTIRQIRTEDELFSVVEKLPQDVGERLLDLAAGKLVTPPPPVSLKASPVENEDASRDLIVIKSRDELRMILDAPMAKWIAFLHPTQKRLARGEFNGAVKVTGSAGTGKTVVAMHRARHLASQGYSVLLTSYVNTLCRNLERNLRLFCLPEELERITVSAVHRTAHDLVKAAGENWQPVEDQKVESLLKEYAKNAECPLDTEGLFAEWRDVIEEQGIATWDEYRGASRVGRGRALTVKDQKTVWRWLSRARRKAPNGLTPKPLKLFSLPSRTPTSRPNSRPISFAEWSMGSTRCAHASIKWPKNAARNCWKRTVACVWRHRPKASATASNRNCRLTCWASSFICRKDKAAHQMRRIA